MSAPMSDREKKKLQEQNERQLLEMVRKPGNNVCCDCGASGPRWASFNIGCFLCIRCGGIHRRMGTHISKVKSISLDKWTPEQLQNVSEWGNIKVNELYLHNASTRPIPTDDDGMEQYIRDKYERRRFLRPGARPNNEDEDSPARGDSRELSNSLKSLYEMGFTDIEKNRRALTRTNLNVNAAIELMCREVDTVGVNTKKSTDPRLAQLKAMGFDDQARNIVALRQSNGSVERAIELLIQDAPHPPPAKASAVLGLSPPKPVANSTAADDLFGDFTSAFTPSAPSKVASNNGANPTEFGDFVFPSPPNQQPAAPEPITAPAEPKKDDKDYIMSLFGSTNSTPLPSMNQFGGPGLQQPNHTPQFGGIPPLSMNQPFGGALPTNPSSPPSTSQFGIGGLSFNSFPNAPTTNNYQGGTQPATTAPVNQLDLAFASLDPFKNQNTTKTPTTSTTNSTTTGTTKPTSQPTQDLLDLL